MAEGHDLGRPENKLSQLMFMIGSWAVSHRISHCHKISNIRMKRSELLCLDLVEKKLWDLFSTAQQRIVGIVATGGGVCRCDAPSHLHSQDSEYDEEGATDDHDVADGLQR